MEDSSNIVNRYELIKEAKQLYNYFLKENYNCKVLCMLKAFRDERGLMRMSLLSQNKMCRVKRFF